MWITRRRTTPSGPLLREDLALGRPDRTKNGELARADGVSKAFGPVEALREVTVGAQPGQILAVLGHNGSGKSTLMRILSGRLKADSGSVTLLGHDVTRSSSPGRARTLGVRIVDQEFPLCPSLTVVENLAINHPEISSWRARRRAATGFGETLAELFPSNDVDLYAEVERLSIAERQMIAIAIAFFVTDNGPECRLLILDEPTSSLFEDRREQLFSYLQRLCDRDVAIVLVSHRLEEVVVNAHQVVVLRDGQRVGSLPRKDISVARLVAMMGVPTAEPSQDGAAEKRTDTMGKRNANVSPTATGKALAKVEAYSAAGLQNVSLGISEGEIVGLGGLEGHGQRTLLNVLFAASKGYRHPRAITVNSSVAYLSGDRNREGIFAGWSVAQNISIGALRRIARYGLVSPAEEAALAKLWIDRLEIRTSGRDSLISNLSGGSQQKVLLARVLASGAKLILLDDPTRGVDVATTAEIYALVHQAVAEGRSFLWYSTDNTELGQCDRVLVMREGTIVDELRGEEVGEQELVSASFAVRRGGDPPRD